MRFRTTILASLFALNLFLCNPCLSQDAWPEMRPPGAVEDLPQELKSLAPFKVQSLLPAKTAKNRAQRYLQTLILLDYSLFVDPPYKWFTEPRAAQAFTSDSKLKKRRKQVVRDLEKIEGFKSKSKGWKPNRDRYVIDEKFRSRFSRIVKNFAWVFDELESAQEDHSNCSFPFVFTREYSQLDSIAAKINLSRLHQIVEAVYAAEPSKQLPLSKACRTYLTLLHDLPPHSSNSFYFDEVFVYEHLIPLILSRFSNEKEVDELVNFFVELIEKTARVDTTAEHAKWQFLCMAIAFIDLRDKDYRNVMQNHSHWNETTAILALRSNAFRDSYRKADIEVMERRLDKNYKNLFSDSQTRKMEELTQKYRDADRQSEIEEQLFCTIISQMTRADFKQELEIHRQRYREIQAACNKTAKERGKKLRKLNDVWTIDPSWTKSPILKFINCNQIHDYELKRRFYRRASLCLTVAKKWRMAHGGKPPTSLEEAFNFANAGKVPNDPYDGKQLRMKNSKVTTSIYSVGPDLKDNRMTSLKSSGNPPKGDLVLTVEFE